MCAPFALDAPRTAKMGAAHRGEVANGDVEGCLATGMQAFLEALIQRPLPIHWNDRLKILEVKCGKMEAEIY